jgi:hypothetical protein
MDDEEKIQWMLSFNAKACRGEIIVDCENFANKAVESYRRRFCVDMDYPANDDGPEAA